ncbi:Peroxisomal NADH pyrophosphatase NUDT12 [Smittium mucronatum]|uniref:NAD(+) diphosphatase n=1 Tax=Smittium mucronatum TaxID=133383 RepID=A0A1R0H6T8_9FUNG|nr:Peroxisomal NADH pyrophosphatase NUDT12 [Smittium mucronatum]
MDISKNNQFFSDGLEYLDRLNSDRSDISKLRSAFNSENSRFILSVNGAKRFLFNSNDNSGDGKRNKLHNLMFLKLSQLRQLNLANLDFYINLNQAPVIIDNEVSPRYSSNYLTAFDIANKGSIVFLGKTRFDPSSNPGFPYRDTFIWAIDTGNLLHTPPAISLDLQITSFFGGELLESRIGSFNLPPQQAHLFAVASSVVDWNYRNTFCPSCGTPTWSAEAGFKRVCVSGFSPSNNPSEVPKPSTSSLPPRLIIKSSHFDPSNPSLCSAQNSLNNFSFPRTDPVVIVAVTSPDNSKILLARRKNFPPFRYSCISGFADPAESIEDVVRRESLEELGITVTNISYYSSQPWPFPNSLMIGVFAQATTDEFSVDTNELAEARWFTFNEIYPAVRNIELNSPHTFPSTVTYPELVPAPDSTNYKAPPAVAIGFSLIQAWCKSQVDPSHKL